MDDLRSTFKVFPTHAQLLELLCIDLAKQASDFDKLLIVLPTLRQANLLRASLATQLVSSKLPRIYSLDKFISSYSLADVADLRVPSAFEEEILLASFLRQEKCKYLPRGSEHELRQFYCDLYERSLEECWLKETEEYLRVISDRDPDVIRHLEQRFLEVEKIRLRFENELERQNMLPAEKLRRRCCRFIAENAQSLFPADTLLYLVGFTSLKTYALQMFAAFAGSLKSHIWMWEQPAILGAEKPLQQIQQSLMLSASKVDLNPGFEFEPWQLHRCRDHLDQVSQACELASEYINSGVRSSEIAILLPLEHSRSGLLRSVVSAQPFKANIAVSISFDQSALGKWLLNLGVLFKRKVAQDEFKSSVRAFFVHPLTRSLLSLGSASRVASLTVHRLIPGDVWGGLQEIIQHWQECQTQLGLKMAKLLSEIQSLSVNWQHSKSSSRLSLTQAVADLSHFLERVGIWKIVSRDQDLMLESSLLALTDIFKQWEQVATLQKIDFRHGEDFWLFASEKMPLFEVRGVGYPFDGVQVLQFIEARMIPFKVVIVLDCVESYLPRALPRDHIIDNSIKKAIGCPGWGYIEALEETNFKLLTDRTPKVHLMVPNQAQGKTVVPSRFVEQAIHQQKAHWVEGLQGGARGLQLDLETQAKKYEQPRYLMEQLGLLPDDPKLWFRNIAVTDLEIYFQCPFRFALKQQGVKTEAAEHMKNAASEGVKLHKVLELFFSREPVGFDQEIPGISETVEHQNWQDWGMQRLMSLTRYVFGDALESSSLIYHLEKYSWPRWLKNFQEFYSLNPSIPIMSDVETEVRLGRGRGVVLDAEKVFGADFSGMTIGIHGQMDLFRQGLESMEVIDYKRRRIPTLKDIKSVHSAQLVLYAFMMSVESPERFDLEKLSMSYWSIFDGTQLSAGFGTKVAMKPLVDEMLTKWKSRLQQHIHQRKPWNPEPGNHCSTCGYQGICRVGERQVSELLESHSLA